MRWILGGFRGNNFPSIVGLIVFAGSAIALFVVSAAAIYQTWGVGAAIVASVSFIWWASIAPVVLWLVTRSLDLAVAAIWVAGYAGLFLSGSLAKAPAFGGSSHEAMPYFRRTQFLWQSNMAGGGRFLVDGVDSAFVFVLLVIGWQANGILGVIVAGLIAATIGGIARALVSLLTGAVISVLIVYPLSAFAAIFTRVPADAVAAPLEIDESPSAVDGSRTPAVTDPPHPAHVHAIGATVWDNSLGQVARVESVKVVSIGAVYTLAYGDGTENQVWDTDVLAWRSDLEPELRRQHKEILDLTEALRASVQRAAGGRQSTE